MASRQVVIHNQAFHEALQPLAIDVVSVQSQVVYGRVGNNVARPELEAAELNVAVVPTVLFSNTPHYPSIHGGSIPPDWFAGYLEDLLARDALRQLRAVLVGYMGDPVQIEILARWLERVREQRPELLVLVDPVIGDEDCGDYVKPGMVEAYREHLLPLATGMTPNAFELKRLAGVDAHGIEEHVAAARSLLGKHTRWVLITSAAPADCPPDAIQVVAVTADEVQIVQHPRINSAARGTGDLFSAAVLSHLLAKASLLDATRFATGRVVAALELTLAADSAELLLP